MQVNPPVTLRARLSSTTVLLTSLSLLRHPARQVPLQTTPQSLYPAVSLAQLAQLVQRGSQGRLGRPDLLALPVRPGLLVLLALLGLPERLARRVPRDLLEQLVKLELLVL